MPSLETGVKVFMTLTLPLAVFLVASRVGVQRLGALPSYEVLQKPFHAQGILYFYQVSKTVSNRLAVYI